MTYDQLRIYLAQGGTDVQHALEAILKHCPDAYTRLLVAKLLDNIEAE